MTKYKPHITSNIDGDMPLLKYGRLIDDCERRTQQTLYAEKDASVLKIVAHTSTCMGKGSCPPPPHVKCKERAVEKNLGSNNQSISMKNVSSKIESSIIPSSIASNSDGGAINFHVLAVGLQNGDVLFYDVETGLSLLREPLNHSLHISANRTEAKKMKQQHAVAALSFDSSGKYLAACRSNGDIAIFEPKYSYGYFSVDETKDTKQKKESDNNDGSGENVFSALFGNLNNPSYTRSKMEDNVEPTKSLPLRRCLQSEAMPEPIRFSFSSPISQVIPTCVAIDPGYARQREKAVVVGFRDGRVVLTKQGFFGRFSNTVIYNSSSGNNKSGNTSDISSVESSGGIETVIWRGALIAWADSTGIKIFDVEQDKRIARIDRPSGARPSLYPNVKNLGPHLCFETSDSLLIAWGDCFMSVNIEVTKEKISSNESSLTEKIVRKVMPGMSWKLDFVACGIAPMDFNHVAILGLFDDEDAVSIGNSNVDSKREDVSTVLLQILHRRQGTVLCADAVVLESRENVGSLVDESSDNKKKKDATLYSLFSSFALPRMDDNAETAENSSTLIQIGEDLEQMLNPLGNMGMGNLFTASESSQKFQDLHLRWNLTEMSSFNFKSSVLPKFIEDKEKKEVVASIPSNDAKTMEAQNSQSLYAPPPVLCISSPYDTIIVRTRDIDDSISHHLGQKNYYLAVAKGIHYRQYLRQHSVSTLVNNYLAHVLNFNEDVVTFNDRNERDENYIQIENRSKALRIKYAARLTPMLLGADVEMWEKWLCEFAKIEGGLFSLREFIPVRDPKLSPQIYEMSLQKMLYEIQVRSTSKVTNSSMKVAKDYLLNMLLGWGPILPMKKRLQLLMSYDDGSHNRCEIMKEVIAINLFMRMHQSSSSYLHESALLTPKAQLKLFMKKKNWKQLSKNNISIGSKEGISKPVDDIVEMTFFFEKNWEGNVIMDSLYDVESLTSSFVDRLPFLNFKEAKSDKYLSFASALYSREYSIALLESVAELFFLAGKYMESLRIYLSIGAYFTSKTTVEKLEDNAIKTIFEAGHLKKAYGDNVLSTQTSSKTLSQQASTDDDYTHVLALLEYHNLHRYLLDANFIPRLDFNAVDVSQCFTIPTPSQESSTSSPIIALIHMVGLDFSSNFLMKNCTLPPVSTTSSSLPISQTAKQLRDRPKLLFWYLHMVMVHRPELYVSFPKTSVPPPIITDLHRKHFNFYMAYGISGSSSEVKQDEDKREKNMAKISYTSMDRTTPFLEFLKVALRYGGIRYSEARTLIESHRLEQTEKAKKAGMKQAELSKMFSLELAYVIEQQSSHGIATEVDAKIILNLYLESEKSLPLAVAYAQRNKTHSSTLWEMLVSFCLNSKEHPEDDNPSGTDYTMTKQTKDGYLFRMLLEAAAQCGADLSYLVSQIPDGLQIQGLRPMILDAISDYKLKLTMHETLTHILTADKIELLREGSHRSRRGVRSVRINRIIA